MSDAKNPGSVAGTLRGTLHTSNAGVVVRRTHRLLPGRLREGRSRAVDVTKRINSEAGTEVTVRAYREFAGGRDHVHYLLNLASLHQYDLVSGLIDEAEEDFGGDILAGSQAEILLIPQHWGMYGTADALPEGVTVSSPLANHLVPPAWLQTSAAPAQTVSADRAEIVLHRFAQPRYAFRGEARTFARRVAESINTRMQGIASSFVFEEAFGTADRVHWVIHMRTVQAYYDLIEMHMRAEPEVMQIYVDDLIPAHKGGGNWARMFVEGSMRDVAMTRLSEEG